jgi:hypothetical protein
MIRKIGTLVLVLAITQFAYAGTTEQNELTHVDLERVGKVSVLGRIDSWTRVDDDTVIIWTTAFRPYLIDLSRPAHDLKFTQTIAVTSTAGQIQEKFDQVIVEGISYPIQAIYKLDRESAKKVRQQE